MRNNRYLVLIILFTLLHGFVRGQNTVGVIVNTGKAVDGYTLFTVLNRTYLINNDGRVVHQWKSNYVAGQSAYLLENGNLLRAAQMPTKGRFTMPSVGGRVELFDWGGRLIWSYNYSTHTAVQHHDICPLPNGNILVLAITVMPEREAVQLGRKLLTPPFRQLYNEQVREIKPKGTNGADIVWEWNVKDHLIQDYDKTKDNYGDVSKNPQRLDINYSGDFSGGANWIHFNSVQYNADLDQILLSSKHLSEIYIIDHSTTTAEAASGSGGKHKRGGDFLYRWGNPAAYKQGTVKDQKLFGQHYAHWIGKGLKDAGKIILFNNGLNRSPEYSEVLIISPPVSAPGEYIFSLPYGPENPDYVYAAPVKTGFYSQFKSSAQRLAEGHILICEGERGRFFEIDDSDNVVWEYINPVGGMKLLSQGEDPADAKNIVFRAIKYPVDYKAFAGRDLTPGSPVEKQRQ